MNFSNLKAFGASLGNSIQDLENTLAGATGSPTSPPPSSRPPRISTSSPRPSLEQRPASPATATSPGSSHVSASSVADSFRERLRKQRASLEAKRESPQRSGSSDSARKVEQPVKEEIEPTPAVPEPPAPKEEDTPKPQPDTPTASAVVQEQPPPPVEQPKVEGRPAAVEEEPEEDGWGLEDTGADEVEDSPTVDLAGAPENVESPSAPVIDQLPPATEELESDPLGASTSPPPTTADAPPAPPSNTDPFTDALLDEPQTELVEIPTSSPEQPVKEKEEAAPIVLLESGPNAASEEEEKEVEEVQPTLTAEPEEIPEADLAEAETPIETAPSAPAPIEEKQFREEVVETEEVQVEEKVEGKPLGEEEELASVVAVEEDESAPSPESAPEADTTFSVPEEAIAEVLDAPLDIPPVDASFPLPSAAESTPAVAAEVSPSPATPSSPLAPTPPAKENSELSGS